MRRLEVTKSLEFLRRAAGWSASFLILTALTAGGAAAGGVELISRADPLPDSSGNGFP
jgi:hypothetical protein